VNHQKHIDRQSAINSKAKEAVSKTLSVLDLSSIVGDRANARKRFIGAVVRASDRFINDSLKNGRELKKEKLDTIRPE
jgi:hypothetical protein